MLITAQIIETENAYGDIIEEVELIDTYYLEKKILKIMQTYNLKKCDFIVEIERL